jgi:hypothetical protein
MELRVATAAGYNVPPGCHIGVRVGEVLKQGRYEPQRSYVFPTMDRRRNAKIDIYRHVGSCVVAVDPEAESKHEVSVASSDPTLPDIKLNVDVQPAPGSKAKQNEEKVKMLKGQAKDYLDKHNIEEKLSLAVKELLRDQPADPTAFLVRHLISKDEKSSIPADLLAECDAALSKQAGDQEMLQRTLKQSREVLVRASRDGQLQTALEAAAAPQCNQGAAKCCVVNSRMLMGPQFYSLGLPNTLRVV